MFEWLKKKKIEEKHEVYSPDVKPVFKPVLPAYLRRQERAFSVVLKTKFCCDKGREKAELIQTNHTSALYGCDPVKCPKYLFKFPLEVMN